MSDNILYTSFMFSSVEGLIKDLLKPMDSCGSFIVIKYFFSGFKTWDLFPYITSEDGKTQAKILSESTISLSLW